MNLLKKPERHQFDERESSQVTGLNEGKTSFRIYDAAPLGFPDYWYPVMWSRRLGRKGVPLTILGERVVFFRDGGRAYALENRCPHRGVSLEGARCDFAGTRSCPYHGWVFDLETGALKAALTDGPDSPVVRNSSTRIRTYPVEERAGLVWIYMGRGDPPPVEQDIPDEFLHGDTVIGGRITERKGDWRHAAENGYDEGHVKYLHRVGVWTFWRRAPAWGYSKPRPTDEDNGWLTRDLEDIGFGAEYPGLGYWPKKQWWRWRPGARGIRVRLPGTLRVQYRLWAHYEWYVPSVVGRHRYLQFVVRRANWIGRLRHRLTYWLYIRPFFHNQFNDQDKWMVGDMETPPEILYRPDISIVSWRRHVEQTARGAPQQPQPKASSYE